MDVRVNLAKESLQEQTLGLSRIYLSFRIACRTRCGRMRSPWPAPTAVLKSTHLFISSLNEMIDLHTSRLTVFRYHIPPPIWCTLYFITILSMATVGYQIGLSGKKAFKVGIVLAMTFSAVVFLVADLDRATEGHLQVSQRPMFELQQKLHMSSQDASQK